MKLNVAHFSRTFLLPTETFIYNQILALNKLSNVNINVFAKRFIDSFNVDEFEIIEINSLLKKRGRIYDDFSYNIFRRLSSLASRQVLKKIYSSEINILHFHYLVDAFYYLDILKNFRGPKVVSSYGWDVSQFPQKFWGLGNILLSSVFRYVDCILAMSDDMKNDLVDLGCPEDKILIHYHGIDTNRFMSINRDYIIKNRKIVILTVASLVEKKGHIFALKAINFFSQKNKNIKYVIVGDGPLLKTLKKFVKENNLCRNVFFKGHIPHNSEELLNLYKESSIFLHPSITSSTGDKEGIPGTIVEAMASGLPIIATNHAGIPEVVKDGENGFLVSEKSHEEIYDKLEIFLNNNELIKKFGEKSRSIAKSLNYSNKIISLSNIYKQLL